MQVGTEWLVDAIGCRCETLRDAPSLRQVCKEIIAALELQVLGEPLWHQFPWPGGVTALYLLTESHLALHSYPESGIVTFNLYCCRPRPDWPWEDRLSTLLGATQVTVHRARRGTGGVGEWVHAIDREEGKR